MAQRKINAVSFFGVQVWIADVKHENARMRPVVIKLFESGGAERMLVVGDKRTAGPERNLYTGATRETHKVALAEITFRVVTVLLNPPTELKTHFLEINPL